MRTYPTNIAGLPRPAFDVSYRKRVPGSILLSAT